MAVCMYIKIRFRVHPNPRFGGTSTRAYTRTQARGATPELLGLTQARRQQDAALRVE